MHTLSNYYSLRLLQNTVRLKRKLVLCGISYPRNYNLA